MAAQSRHRLLTFNDPHPMRIDRDLAAEIGLNESILLLQIEYLISISSNERDGRLWTYQTLDNLRETYFPWWSVTTLHRIVKSLTEKGLIVVGNFNKLGYDRTQWFALNEDGINSLHSVAIFHNEKSEFQNEKSIFQNDKIDPAKMKNGSYQNETTIPESTQRIPESTTESEKRPRKSAGRAPTQASMDPFSEAVTVYRQLTNSRPPPTTTALIADTVTDIEARKVPIQAWCDRGVKPSNVAGMIDWYLHPDKQQGRANVKQHIRQGSGPNPERKPQVEADHDAGW
jgi:hypothetical protein